MDTFRFTCKSLGKRKKMLVKESFHFSVIYFHYVDLLQDEKIPVEALIPYQ